MIPSLEAIKAINARRADAVVVSGSRLLEEWASVSGRRDLDLELSDCAYHAASVALGIALAQPHRKTLVVEGNSTQIPGLDSLVTVGRAAPRNLVHFFFEDSGRHSTDDRPEKASDGVDLHALAHAAGYPRTYRFEELEEFFIGLEDVLGQDGPTFVCLKVIHDWDVAGQSLRPMVESFGAVKNALAQEEVPIPRARILRRSQDGR